MSLWDELHPQGKVYSFCLEKENVSWTFKKYQHTKQVQLK